MEKSKLFKAVLVGLAIVLLGIGGRIATGSIYSSAEAMDLIGAVQSSALYLGSAMATSSGTILALMLTLVGFVHRVDHEFSDTVYCDILTIGWLSTLSLVGSVVMLLILTLPLGDFEELPRFWYPWLYNIIYAIVVALSALLVGNVVMLYLTLRGLLNELRPNLSDRDET